MKKLHDMMSQTCKYKMHSFPLYDGSSFIGYSKESVVWQTNNSCCFRDLNGNGINSFREVSHYSMFCIYSNLPPVEQL
jgi:hypothetical protein